MEIGSFIELSFPSGMEYYTGNHNIIRLNSGRAAIWHAARLWNCENVYLPIYQCETVSKFLKKKNITIEYYHINSDFDPDVSDIPDNACIVLVNYYGIMSHDRMAALSRKYKRVIIDNSQAFFNEPVEEAYNVYSARKFVGSPDGAYVIGENAERFEKEYPQGYSSDTSLFLLQRIEYGCEGKTYLNRTENEKRLDNEDVSKMSHLTRAILDSSDYNSIIKKRKENFVTACELFDAKNLLNVKMHYDSSAVPMVYPLVMEDDTVLDKLLSAKHFQGHWWNYILEKTKPDSFE